MGLTLGQEDTLEEGIATPVFLPGEPHGQSLVSLGPLGPKESDMTEVTSHTRAHICVSL